MMLRQIAICYEHHDDQVPGGHGLMSKPWQPWLRLYDHTALLLKNCCCGPTFLVAVHHLWLHDRAKVFRAWDGGQPATCACNPWCSNQRLRMPWPAFHGLGTKHKSPSDNTLIVWGRLRRVCTLGSRAACSSIVEAVCNTMTTGVLGGQ